MTYGILFVNILLHDAGQRKGGGNLIDAIPIDGIDRNSPLPGQRQKLFGGHRFELGLCGSLGNRSQETVLEVTFIEVNSGLICVVPHNTRRFIVWQSRRHLGTQKA